MIDTRPPAPEPGPALNRFPPQIKFIVGNEACERFSYYGMVGILELYLADRMKMGGTEATKLLHLFGAAVYFLPLLGGWLADRWLGRYWTILGISFFYCLGHGTLALFEGSRAGLFAGLALIAIGAGGIKPCVSAFVGDQFGQSQHYLLTKVYGWFYWSINLGAAAAFFIIPRIHTRAGYPGPLAFRAWLWPWPHSSSGSVAGNTSASRPLAWPRPFPAMPLRTEKSSCASPWYFCPCPCFGRSSTRSIPPGCCKVKT